MKIVKGLFNIIVILLWLPALILCHGTCLILALGVLVIWFPIAASVMDILYPYLRGCGLWEGWVMLISLTLAGSATIIGTVLYTVVVSIPLVVLSPINARLWRPIDKAFREPF